MILHFTDRLRKEEETPRETNTLTFRKAEARDLDAAEAIYDKIHAREDAG